MAVRSGWSSEDGGGGRKFIKMYVYRWSPHLGKDREDLIHLGLLNTECVYLSGPYHGTEWGERNCVGLAFQAWKLFYIVIVLF